MHKKTIAYIIFLLTTFCLPSCLLFSSTSQLQKAEEFSRQKKYAEAISAYRTHMQERLQIKDRPEWENPYFYLILIGDIELGTDKPEDALNSYLEAEEKKVDLYLVSDRIRSVCRWYEEKGEFDKAIEILLRYRDQDSLLFEAMLDRLNKAKTLKEDQKAIH